MAEAAPAAHRGHGDAGRRQQIVGAVSNLPSLALPPITGLLVLLLGYIVLIGPINYLVLQPARPARVGVGDDAGPDRRVHRRRLRHRGRPAWHRRHRQRGGDRARRTGYRPRAWHRSTSASSAPPRATFQLTVDGDALLATPMNGDFFGGRVGVRPRRPPGRPGAGPGPRGRASARCARSAPRRVPWRPRSTRTSSSGTAGSRAPSRTRPIERSSPRRSCSGSSATTLQDIGPGQTVNVELPPRRERQQQLPALGQGGRAAVVRQLDPQREPAAAPRAADRSSTSSPTTR